MPMCFTQVHTFLQLTGDHVIPAHLRAPLTRQNELWAFQESLLGHGKSLLHETFLDACITLTVQQRDEGAAGKPTSIDLPPVVQGHLDSRTLLLSQSFLLRRQIMSTLMKMLPLRHMSLLLVVQARRGSPCPSPAPKLPAPLPPSPLAGQARALAHPLPRLPRTARRPSHC